MKKSSDIVLYEWYHSVSLLRSCIKFIVIYALSKAGCLGGDGGGSVVILVAVARVGEGVGRRSRLLLVVTYSHTTLQSVKPSYSLKSLF